jgi:outer membrane receptor protein involved in Fe transport
MLFGGLILSFSILVYISILNLLLFFMRLLFFPLFFPIFNAFCQLDISVVDADTKEGVPMARLVFSDGFRAVANMEGSLFLERPFHFPLVIYVSASNFVNDSIFLLESVKELKIQMKAEVAAIDQVVVTAGRREQRVEDVSISMETLKPNLVDNKGITDLEQAVDQSPGVYAMDGQVSIRGGGGFSYGAGSRVLLLWNGIPMISGDAGDAKWNSIPMENASQIEVLKGASSVLYGSGALNGIISLTEREPKAKGETRAKIQSGWYGSPRRSSLKWWTTPPTFHQMEVYHGKMQKQFGYTIATNAYTNVGYREGESEKRARIAGSLFFKPKRHEGFKAGVGYNFFYQNVGSFLIWQSDSLGYTPSGGSDTSDVASTLNYSMGTRISVDPYLKYTDAKANKHQLKTRVYYVDNQFLSKPEQDARSVVYFADYQFQRTWNNRMTITSGATASNSVVHSQLFGNHEAINTALYGQFEQKINRKFDFTSGVRFEYFSQDGLTGDSDYYLGKNDFHLRVYPIVRTAAHYKVAKYTHFRASFGQGVRYPSVAERYTRTSVGSLLVFPNPDLKRETGWAAELGLKQVVKIGFWKGLLDVVGFINQYDNMMEFTFGFYLPDSVPPSVNPGNPGYVGKWLGFQAQNAEKARISGLEFSFSSEGKLRNVELTSLLGYTYINPISLNFDSTYRSSFSDSGSTMLKYRFKHLAKADMQATWKNMSLGLSMRYNSVMSNIDAPFEDGLSLNGYPIIVNGQQVEILPGLKKYREQHNRGSLVFDARMGYEWKDQYRFGFIVNNLLNAEYSTRPGDIQAPRSFMFQIRVKL